MADVATFNGATRIVTLTEGGDVNVRDLYSSAVRWLDNNPGIAVPFDAIGGDVIDPTAGLYTAVYVRCVNDWRVVAPYSVNITGGVLMVFGGGESPFVIEEGTIQIQYKTPVEAIGFSTGGAGATLTKQDVRNAMLMPAIGPVQAGSIDKAVENVGDLVVALS